VMDGFSVPFSGPLHEQVHRALRSRIVSGEWKPRELLPGEIALSQELGVSVGTIRKAMDQLARDNIIVRERGRGTYVRGDSEWRTNSAFRLCGLDGAPLTPCIRLVDVAIGAATPQEARALKLSHGSLAQPVLLRLRREWLCDDYRICSETLILEETRFRGIVETADPAAETLFAAYTEVYRTRIDAIQWEIGLSALRKSSTPAVGSDPVDSVLPIRRTALDPRGKPVEVCELLVMQNRCSVQIRR
jgi:GntR family transcriptional regulator